MFRVGLARLLQSQGILTLGETHSAETTFELVGRYHPHLAIISLSLADQSGLEVIDALRQAHPNMALLAMSSSHSELARQSALRAGANLLVSKTQDLQQLVQAIRHLAEPPRPGLQRRKGRYVSLRQIRILRALTSGHTNEEIAHHLNFSRSTIKAELRSLFETFATQDRSQLISKAAFLGLIGN